MLLICVASALLQVLTCGDMLLVSCGAAHGCNNSGNVLFTQLCRHGGHGKDDFRIRPQHVVTSDHPQGHHPLFDKCFLCERQKLVKRSHGSAEAGATHQETLLGLSHADVNR